MDVIVESLNSQGVNSPEPTCLEWVEWFRRVYFIKINTSMRSTTTKGLSGSNAATSQPLAIPMRPISRKGHFQIGFLRGEHEIRVSVICSQINLYQLSNWATPYIVQTKNAFRGLPRIRLGRLLKTFFSCA